MRYKESRKDLQKSSAWRSCSWTELRRARPAMNMEFIPLIMKRSQTLSEA